MKRFSVFWGCTIPARFPFIEKSTRLVLDDLGAEVGRGRRLHLLPRGHAGQGGRRGGRTTSPPPATWRLPGRRGAAAHARATAATPPSSRPKPSSRPTGGCKERVNELLAQADLSLDEACRRSRHLAEWLSTTRSVRRRSPSGSASRSGACASPCTTAATCCGPARPSAGTARPSPTKLEDLVRALGATVVDYETKMDCCGGALDRVGERDDASGPVPTQADRPQRGRGGRLVVVCPSCFLQFDLNQAALQRQKEALRRPGLLPVRAHRPGHGPRARGARPGPCTGCRSTPFLEKWARRQEAAGRDRPGLLGGRAAEVQRLPRLRRRLPGDQDRRRVQPHDHHRRDPRRATSTASSSAATSGSAWSASPATRSATAAWAWPRCSARSRSCPWSGSRCPRRFASAYDTFLETGSLGEPRESARVKLGLAPLAERGGEELLRSSARGAGEMQCGVAEPASAGRCWGD